MVQYREVGGEQITLFSILFDYTLEKKLKLFQETLVFFIEKSPQRI